MRHYDSKQSVIHHLNPSSIIACKNNSVICVFGFFLLGNQTSHQVNKLQTTSENGL